MNRLQHAFIWVGIVILMVVAIRFESKLIWLFPTIALISECVYLSRDMAFPKDIESLKSMPRKFWILLLCIAVFIIIFLIATYEKPKRIYISRRSRMINQKKPNNSPPTTEKIVDQALRELNLQDND